MATRIFEREVIVSGLGISDTGRTLQQSGLELALDACLAAVDDAGLSVADVDGLASMGETHPDDVHETLGLETQWVNARDNVTGGQLHQVISAAMAIASGMCRHVLVYRSVKRLNGLLRGGPEGEWEWHIPFHDYSAASMFAMHARRHMHDYGTTKEQLGWIALNGRRHAALNPKAALREPLTMDDYLGARPVAEPFGLLDCDYPIDGAVALILSTRDYAADCPQPAVGIEAISSAVKGRKSWDQRSGYPAMMAKVAAANLWARTDLVPSDVDVAELYDGFSFLTLSWLEALGFCDEGAGGAFVDGGHNTAIGGALPLNTYGGQLSAGRLHGYWLLHEAVLQLRHQATGRQVAGAEVAAASCSAGPNAGCVLFTRCP